MRCSICGAETGDAQRVCDRCRQAQADVQVLTPDERDRFTGITIDVGEQQRDYNQSHHAGRGVFIRHITLDWRGGLADKAGYCRCSGRDCFCRIAPRHHVGRCFRHRVAAVSFFSPLSRKYPGPEYNRFRDIFSERAFIIEGRSSFILEVGEYFVNVGKQLFFILRQRTGQRQQVGDMIAAK